MEIGIIGTGSVGIALARGFTAAGHDVTLGSRTPEDQPDGLGAAADQVAVRAQATALDNDVVVLATPVDAAIVIAGEHADTLAGSVVIDPTNEYPTASKDRSVAERLAEVVPEAAVVKAFNTIGADHMPDPVVAGDPATMFVAGDDAEACETAGALARDLGFEVLDAGDLEAARHLEHLARFWIHLSMEHGRDIGFRLLRE